MVPGMAAPILILQQVRKRFGGLWAVDGVDLQLQAGERRAIIGPNGAGKTTLFNLVSGQLRCDSGHVLFRGQNIRRLSPARVCQQGMSRTFQITSIFPQMTVLENVQVALYARHRQSLRLFDVARQRLAGEALELLRNVELHGLAQPLAGSLSHGDQKRLDLAIALANDPVLLLLDEPTAGMPTAERREAMALVLRLVRDRGLTLLFTEHDMDVVFSAAERISVLHQGQLLAEGTPDEVRASEEVRRVYLGWKGHRS
jgi:branched-chain amino acid transport system ATP-binding protein